MDLYRLAIMKMWISYYFSNSICNRYIKQGCYLKEILWLWGMSKQQPICFPSIHKMSISTNYSGRRIYWFPNMFPPYSAWTLLNVWKVNKIATHCFANALFQTNAADQLSSLSRISNAYWQQWSEYFLLLFKTTTTPAAVSEASSQVSELWQSFGCNVDLVLSEEINLGLDCTVSELSRGSHGGLACQCSALCREGWMCQF